MRCPQCGEAIPDGSRFCPKCGADLSVPSAQLPAPNPEPSVGPAKRSGAAAKIAIAASAAVIVLCVVLVLPSLLSDGGSDYSAVDEPPYATDNDGQDGADTPTSTDASSGSDSASSNQAADRVSVTDVDTAPAGPDGKLYVGVKSPDFGDDEKHYLAEDGTVYDEIPWTYVKDDDGGLTFYSDYTHTTKVGECRPEDTSTDYRCVGEYDGLYLVWMTRTSPRTLDGEDSSGTYIGLMKPDGTWFGTSPLEIEAGSVYAMSPEDGLCPTDYSPYAVFTAGGYGDCIVANFKTGLVEKVEGTAGAEAALTDNAVIFRLDDVATRGTYCRYQDGELTTLPDISGYLGTGCKDGFLTDPDDGSVNFYAPDGTLMWSYSEHTVESVAVVDGTVYAYLRADGDENKYQDFSHYYLATLDISTGAVTNEPFLYTARGIIGDTTFVSSAEGDSLVRISTGKPILQIGEGADFGTTGSLQWVEEAGTYRFFDGAGNEVFPHRA